MAHTASSQPGAGRRRAMSAETMKMPEPIIEPATSAVASRRPSRASRPVGPLVAYAVGVRGGRPAIERWGRFVLLGHRELELAERWFARWGRQTVFWARLLPVVRTFIALPAGIAQMELWPFMWLTFAGSLPWCWALAHAGFKLGEN